MFRLIRSDEREVHQREIVGGKAWGLARLTTEFPQNVPDWFVIITSPGSESSNSLSDPDCEVELRQLLRPHMCASNQFAVRSSAAVEDAPNSSFAGQFFTALCVSGVESVARAVLECMRSATASNVRNYSSRKRVSFDGRFAAVVQKMVPAEKSGVLFTRHPVDKSKAVVINATFGLGNMLVTGEVTPDTIVVDPPDRIIKYDVGHKLHMAVATARGVENLRLPKEDADKAVLSNHEIIELVDVACRCEQALLMPLDMEWSFSRERLFLLQARPITAL